MLRTLALSSAFVFAAGLAVAQDPMTPPQEPQNPAAAEPAASQIREGKARVTAQVVSADPTAKTITVRNVTVIAAKAPTGAASAGAVTDTVTLPVEGKAIATLKQVNRGDNVRLTCISGREAGDIAPATSGSSGSTSAGGTTATGGMTGSTGSTATATGMPGAPGTPGMSGTATPPAQAACKSVIEIFKVKDLAK